MLQREIHTVECESWEGSRYHVTDVIDLIPATKQYNVHFDGITKLSAKLDSERTHNWIVNSKDALASVI